MQLLDADGSGGLSYGDMYFGLKKLDVHPGIHLSREDFDNLTRYGDLLNESVRVTHPFFSFS